MVAVAVSKRGEVWRARYRDELGRQHSRSFAKKSQGEAWVAEQLRAIKRGEWIDPDTTITLSDYAASWVPRQPFRQTTVALWESFIRRQLEGHRIGEMRVHQIRAVDCQQWMTWLTTLTTSTGKPFAGRTLAARMFRTLLGEHGAVGDGLIVKNPATSMMLPTSAKEVEPFVPLTTEQVELIARACAGTPPTPRWSGRMRCPG